MTMKCPNCRVEFVDGTAVCTDCQTPLVKKEELKKGTMDLNKEGDGVEMLTSVSDHLEAALLQGILENHGIPSYSLDRESGSYMRVCMGFSLFGEDIYVRSSDAWAAHECLEEWEAVKESGDLNDSNSGEAAVWQELPESGEITPNEDEPVFKNPLIMGDKRTVAIVLLIAAIILLLNTVIGPIL